MIELRDVRFRYRADLPEVLCGVSAVIPDGSFVGLMGSNGSGKSTLARCLNGLLEPTSGAVHIDGLSSADPQTRVLLRQKIGLVFQNPNHQITSATVERELAFGLENYCVPHDEMHARVAAMLAEAGLEDWKNSPPTMLSAGDRQRLAIASILILQPTCLILDESTSLLSARSRTRILEQLMALRRSRHITVILVTQYPSEALMCDRLLILDKGVFAFDGIPMKVFQNTDALIRMGVSIPISNRLEALR